MPRKNKNNFSGDAVVLVVARGIKNMTGMQRGEKMFFFNRKKKSIFYRNCIPICISWIGEGNPYLTNQEKIILI